MSPTPISPAKLAANRQNAKFGTGPKSPQARAKVRFNALKHGLTATTVVLPGEDPALFEAKLDGYKAELQPRTERELDLVEEMVRDMWKIKRAHRVDHARLIVRTHTACEEAARKEAMDAVLIGRRLFHDRSGPAALYPTPRFGPANSSWLRDSIDPDDPAILVMQLDATSAGCRWQLDRLAELRGRLDNGQNWQAPDKFKFVRLQGKQPLDAADDPEVALVYVACNAISGGKDQPFGEQKRELYEEEWVRYGERLVKHGVHRTGPRNAEEARATLVALVDRAVDRVNLVLAQNQESEAELASWTLQANGFDESTTGELRRRYKTACQRSCQINQSDLFQVRSQPGVSAPPVLESAVLECSEPPHEVDAGEARESAVLESTVLESASKGSGDCDGALADSEVLPAIASIRDRDEHRFGPASTKSLRINSTDSERVDFEEQK
jgi:hypothetical protein